MASISSPIPISAPPPSPFFAGRNQLIKKIGDEITLPDSSRVIALVGMGGIGKTALAKKIAESVCSKFPGGIFWANELPIADGNPSIILKKWAALCGQNLEQADEETITTTVRGLLLARKSLYGPLLIIVDDVRLNWTGNGIKDIQEAIPPGIPLIITTRQVQAAQEAHAKVYEIKVLPRTEACRVLLSVYGEKIAKSDADLIAEYCGDMPLALELMASLAQTRGIDWVVQRLQTETNKLDILKLPTDERKEQSVKISLQISYQALVDRYPETARLFRFLGAFAKPTFIVLRDLVSSYAELWTEQATALYAEPQDSTTNSESQWPRDGYESDVFVSYAWGGESERMVDEIEQTLSARGIRIVRDKKDLAYKGSIKEFEDRIGRGQCIVLVISDKYLRSRHCMYELLEVEKNRNLRERIFPIVLSDAPIYDPIQRLDYITYWEKESVRLETAIRQAGSLANLQAITEELNTYVRIRANLDHLTNLLSDMNVLTPEIHTRSGFSSLVYAITQVLPSSASGSTSAMIPSPVIGTDTVAPPMESVEDHFMRLADWSFVFRDESIPGGRMRYFHMHTLLHDYARSLLSNASELERATDSHMRYCAVFAAANPNMDLQRQDSSTFEFENSYAQLLQALTEIKARTLPKVQNWADEPLLCQQIIALVGVLDHHWQNHSQFSEQEEWFEVAYLCAGAIGDILKQADFARRTGRALTWQGKWDDALGWMKQCETVLSNNPTEAADSIRALMYIHRASINFQQSALETVEEDCNRGLSLVDKMKHPRIYAEGCNLLGAIRGRSGKLSSALEALGESLSVWKQLGDQAQIFRVEDNIRTAHFYIGDIANARKAEESSRQYWERFPFRVELAMSLTNLGLLLHCQGENEESIELQREGIKIADRLHVPRMRAMTRVNLAWPLISMAKFDEAEACLKESIKILTEYKSREYQIEAQRALAEVELGRGRYSCAIELAQNALDLAREYGEPLDEGAALRILGQAYRLLGDLEQGKEYLRLSLSLLQENEFKYEAYLTLRALVALHKDRKELDEGQEALSQSEALSKEMGL